MYLEVSLKQVYLWVQLFLCIWYRPMWILDPCSRASNNWTGRHRQWTDLVPTRSEVSTLDPYQCCRAIYEACQCLQLMGYPLVWKHQPEEKRWAKIWVCRGITTKLLFLNAVAKVRIVIQKILALKITEQSFTYHAILPDSRSVFVKRHFYQVDWNYRLV